MKNVDIINVVFFYQLISNMFDYNCTKLHTNWSNTLKDIYYGQFQLLTCLVFKQSDPNGIKAFVK